jgi:hypothetical protein
VNGAVETGDSATDDDQSTTYAYDGSDHVTEMSLLLPSAGEQTTEWTYEARKSTSEIDSNELLSAITMPGDADVVYT